MALPLHSCQIRSHDSGQYDAIEGTGAADAGDAGGDFLDVAKMEQVGSDEWTQHAGDKGDRRRMWQALGHDMRIDLSLPCIRRDTEERSV